MLYIFIAFLLMILTLTFYAVLKVLNLVSIAKKGNNASKDTANNISAYLMLIFLIVLIGGFWWYFFEVQPDLLPEAASEHGLKTDELFYIAVGVILIPFILLNTILFYAAFRFRYNKNRRAKFYPKNNRLEIIWTIVPTLVFTTLILMGSRLWSEITNDAPQNSEVIEVMGFQFAWKVRYPGIDQRLGTRNYKLIDAVNDFGMDMSDPNVYDDFIPREIHIPKGKPVLLKIFSKDVIHSVFLPHFRVKMDAVPGMGTQFWFVPRLTTAEMREKTGNPEFNYEMACTEVCGRGHFSMRMTVVVEETEDYEKWKLKQTAWLKKNPEYVSKIPESLKSFAIQKADITNEKILKKSNSLAKVETK